MWLFWVSKSALNIKTLAKKRDDSNITKNAVYDVVVARLYLDKTMQLIDAKKEKKSVAWHHIGHNFFMQTIVIVYLNP